MRKDDVTYVRVTREIYTPVCVYSIYCIYIYKREREREGEREKERETHKGHRNEYREREKERRVIYKQTS